MTRRIIAMLTLIAMLFTCSAAFAAGQLRVGMECNYAPYNWTQAEPSEFAVPIEGGGGYADGYDVQIARAIADALDMELVIVKTEWDGLPMGVVTGAFDAIIAGMSPTEERKLTLDFSDNYYTSELVIVVRKDSAFAAAQSLSDLGGANITGQLNTFHYSVIDQIPGVNKAMAMETFPAMVVALRAGAIDGYVAEKPGAIADTTANPDLTFIEFEDGNGFATTPDEVSIAIGLQKGSPLLEGINAALANISEDARVQMMLDATARQPLNQ